MNSVDGSRSVGPRFEIQTRKRNLSRSRHIIGCFRKVYGPVAIPRCNSSPQTKTRKDKVHMVTTHRTVRLRAALLLLSSLIASHLTLSQWTQIDAPATDCSVAVSDNGSGSAVVIFLTGTDNNIYYNTLDLNENRLLSTWQEATFPGSVPRNWFDSPPTCATLKGELYVFGRIRKFGNPTFNMDLPENTIYWAHTIGGQSK